MKKIIILIFIICLFPINVGAIEKDVYVNDSSNILSEEDISYIVDKSNQLESISGEVIIVVTIDSLDGEDISVYSDNILLDYGLSEEESNNSVLFLFVEDEKILRIDVGEGLDEILTFNKVKDFTEDYVDYNIIDKKYDEAIINGFNAIYKELIVTKNLSLEYTNPIKDSEEDNSISTVEVGIMIILALILFFLGWKSNLYKKNKSKYNILFIILSGSLIISSLFISIFAFLLCLVVYLSSLLINRYEKYTGKVSLFNKKDDSE